jgi:TonB-dependent starch-binding outer membrane protein SusC
MKKASLSIYFMVLFAFFSFGSFAQKTTNVVGTVTDERGETLPGVNVLVKGISKGTVTDINGKFTISLPGSSNVLMFSYIGYESKEMKADAGKPMQVVLKEESRTLNEVMVVGYQDVRKKDLTGSVAKANITDMLKAPVASFDQALAGRVAGVNVSSGEGTPGGTMNIVIRGNNSISQGNSPLYVIDGFPVEDPAIGSSINPNDIESIDVLKDASSTAIYGARGANGVIIITTKKGVVGAPKISYDGSYGVQRVTHKIQMMDAYEFVRLQQEIDPVGVASATGYLGTYNGKTYTLDDYRNATQFNWQDMILRDAPQQSHSVSLTGGTSDVRYNASLSYYDQDGVVIKSNYNRIQGRMGVTIRQNKLNINLSTNYSQATAFGSSPSQQVSSGMTNLFYSVWGYRPVTQPGVDINSLLDNNTDSGVDPLNDYRFNPVLSLNNEYRKNVSTNNQFNGYVEYEFLKGLKLKVSGGYTVDGKRNEAFNNSKTRYGSASSNDHVNATLFTSERKTWLNENILTYQNVFKKVHSFNGMIGMTMQGSDYNYYSMKTNNIPNESLGMAGMSQGTAQPVISGIAEWSMMSYLGRINYNYKSKYYFTASFRADGSSKFPIENRWGYFPSTSLAWNFMDESFMKPLNSVIKNGKLRLSWGQTGNNRVGEYDYSAQLSIPLAQNGSSYLGTGDYISGIYGFNNSISTNGTIPVNLPNSALKWETTAQTNAGIDLSFLNDRVNFTFDWYNKNTTDLLLYAALPISSGFGGATKNIGAVQNQGVEFTVNTVNIKTKKFTWSTNFNISFNKNTVLGMSDNQLSWPNNGYFDQNYTASNYIAKNDYPIGMMYGYMYQGTYKVSDFDYNGSSYTLKTGIPHYVSEGATQPGYPKYADLNHDGIIDSNDQTMIGRGAPIHTGGFTNNFEYAGFDLSIFLQWSYGANILNANRLMFEGFNKKKDVNQFASYANRWTFDNQTSDIPVVSNSTSNGLFSSRVIEDGSYLRLKTVSLGYSIPTKLLKKLSMSKVHLYVSAQNLFTLTKYSGYDPEVSIRNTALTPGLDFSSYPRAASMNVGINVSF